MSKTVQNDSKNHYNGNPICQRSNRLSCGGIGVLPLKQLYIFNIIRIMRTHMYANVSTAHSVAFINLQLYIMKNEHRFIFGHSHLHNMQFRQQNYYKFLTCARKIKKKYFLKRFLQFFYVFFLISKTTRESTVLKKVRNYLHISKKSSTFACFLTLIYLANANHRFEYTIWRTPADKGYQRKVHVKRGQTCPR